MRLFPPELEIGDDEGFTAEKDFFGREEFGERLGNLFANVEDPMVAILDAPWGSGKTTFIKMWCGHMRNRSFPVIYFDAFKNDYTDDAFLALAGEVIALADELKPVDGEARQDYLAKAKRVAWAAAKGGFKRGLGKILGDEGVDDVVAAATEGGSNCLLESFDAYLKAKLEGRKKERDAFNEFGKALAVLAEELSKATQAKQGQKDAKGEAGQTGAEDETQGSAKRPLIFVIDELDRCKPPFALDLLEKIKHFFSVPHVHFLLVTHMDQLENSVRYAYGMNEHAGLYLQKFYHFIFCLPTETNVYGRSVCDSSRYIDKLFNELFQDIINKDLKDDLCTILTNYSSHHNITLRSLQKLTTQIRLYVAATGKSHFRLSPIIATLCIMKTIAPKLYQKAQSKHLSLEEVSKFMSFEEDNRGDHWCQKWWGFCIGDAQYLKKNEQEMETCRNALFRYSVDDRADIVPRICAFLNGLTIDKE